MPNVSGGLVISKIPQNTKWDLDSNVKYARTAEEVGFEYALSQIRFMAGYGAVSKGRGDRSCLASKAERALLMCLCLIRSTNTSPSRSLMPSWLRLRS